VADFNATLDGDIGGLAFPVDQYTIRNEWGTLGSAPQPSMAEQFQAAISGALVSKLNQYLNPTPKPSSNAQQQAASSSKLSTNQIIGFVAIGGAVFLLVRAMKG